MDTTTPTGQDAPNSHPATPRYTLDGEPVDIAELIAVNHAVLDADDIARIDAMQPGEQIIFGGGAAAEFVLRREPDTIELTCSRCQRRYLTINHEYKVKVGSKTVTRRTTDVEPECASCTFSRFGKVA